MNWYCLHTKPAKEAQVAAYCHTTLGLEAFYPKLSQHRTIRRVRRLVIGPLFPRYLFCRLDVSTDYRSARYAPDALDLVHFGHRPAIVPIELITALKKWAGDSRDTITLRPQFQPGDQVEISDGPLRGLPAIILRATDDKDRVAVLLSVLQEGVQMTISRAQLRRAEPHHVPA